MEWTSYQEPLNLRGSYKLDGEGGGNRPVNVYVSSLSVRVYSPGVVSATAPLNGGHLKVDFIAAGNSLRSAAKGLSDLVAEIEGNIRQMGSGAGIEAAERVRINNAELVRDGVRALADKMNGNVKAGNLDGI